jgi:hypothetical protein
MSSKSIPGLAIAITNSDEGAAFNDRQAFAHCITSLRLSRRRLLPKSVSYNGFRLTRSVNRVTVHLHLDDRETARVSFIPTHDFSRVRI